MSRLHLFRTGHQFGSLTGERQVILRYLRDAEGVLRSQGHEQATYVTTGRQALEQAGLDLSEAVAELLRVDEELLKTRLTLQNKHNSYKNLLQDHNAATNALSKVPFWVRRIFGAHHV